MGNFPSTAKCHKKPYATENGYVYKCITVKLMCHLFQLLMLLEVVLLLPRQPNQRYYHHRRHHPKFYVVNL